MADNSTASQDPIEFTELACMEVIRGNGLVGGCGCGVDAGVGVGGGLSICRKAVQPYQRKALKDSTDVNTCSKFDSRMMERMVNSTTTA